MYEFISGFSDEIAADIDTQFSVLNKLGIKYFEPRGVNGKNISELNEEEVLQLKSKMDEYGIAVSSIGSPVGKIYLEEDYEPHFEMFKRVVKTAKILGTRNIRIFSFYHNGDEWTAEEMYKRGLCDTVIIAVPHYDHPKLAISAFDYGLNVITEKPAGVYTKQVKEMNDVAAKSDKLFGIMYNQRTRPVYGKLRQMIQNGELGNIKRITWIITDWYRCQAYHDSSTWRSTRKTEGGGAVINQNPHQLDLWQWLFGMPDRIYAKASFGKYYDIEVEDDVMAFMEYDNGTTGEYITSTGEAPGTNRLEIACGMGKIVIENDTLKFWRNVVSEREFNKNNDIPFGAPECWECKIPVEFEGEEHIGIFKNFANAVLCGGKLLAPGEEGIKGLTISNAIHMSAWTGETVDVKNFDDERFYNLLCEKIKNSTVVKKESQVVVDNSSTY